ncbi:MAG: hypothetical protein MHMPM18_003411, partial [Marteilia pararefringens]
PKALALQRALEECFGTRIAVSIAGGRQSSFEVTLENSQQQAAAGPILIYSKLEKGTFPQHEFVLEAARPHVPEEKN